MWPRSRPRNSAPNPCSLAGSVGFWRGAGFAPSSDHGACTCRSLSGYGFGEAVGAAGAELIANDPAEMCDGGHQCAFNALQGIDT